MPRNSAVRRRVRQRPLRAEGRRGRAVACAAPARAGFPGRTPSSTNCMCAASRACSTGHAGRVCAAPSPASPIPPRSPTCKQLGVTTLELMPCAAWIDERHLRAAGLTNYWGYNPVAFCAPDPRLAPGGWREVRESVAALQDGGLRGPDRRGAEPHRRERRRGPDRLAARPRQRSLLPARSRRPRRAMSMTPAAATSCGSTIPLSCASPWTRCAPGRITAASTASVSTSPPRLRRRAEGFDPHAPLLAAIAQDPLLRDLKLDRRALGHRAGRLPARRLPAALGRMERQFPRRGAQILARRRRHDRRNRHPHRRLGRSFRRTQSRPRAASISSPPMTASRWPISCPMSASTTRPTAKAIATEPTPIIRGTTASKARRTDEAILAARRRDQRNLLAAAAAVARHADAVDGRRARPQPARQQQRLCPGQRDRLARLGQGRRAADRLHQRPDRAAQGHARLAAGPFPDRRAAGRRRPRRCRMARRRWRNPATRPMARGRAALSRRVFRRRGLARRPAVQRRPR